MGRIYREVVSNLKSAVASNIAILDHSHSPTRRYIGTGNEKVLCFDFLCLSFRQCDVQSRSAGDILILHQDIYFGLDFKINLIDQITDIYYALRNLLPKKIRRVLKFLTVTRHWKKFGPIKKTLNHWSNFYQIWIGPLNLISDS